MKTRRLALLSALVLSVGVAAPPTASSAIAATATTGMWAATASMAVARADVTATRLGNGRVLVVGGVNEPTTELYDPPTGTWLPGGTLNQPRWLHAAVRLADGRVLVAGGGAYTATAELYDPATNRWTPTGSMSVDRYGFTATLLRDGRVLVVGGFSSAGPQASAELFDPATGRWTPDRQPPSGPPEPHRDPAGGRPGPGRGRRQLRRLAAQRRGVRPQPRTLDSSGGL